MNSAIEDSAQLAASTRVRDVTFTMSDQRAFAQLSGDFNPMHLDPVASRRFMYGEVVVHGIHLLLRGIELLADAQPRFAALASVDVEFRTPAKLGIPVRFTISERGEREVGLVADVDATLAMRATLTWGERDGPEPMWPSPTEAWQSAPDVLLREHMRDIADSTPLVIDRDATRLMFPALPVAAMADQLAVLLATTRIVGMHCPGYHSIYSQLQLTFDAKAGKPAPLRYALDGFDERFNMADVSLDGNALDGRIKAFLRPTPQAQPNIVTIARQVRPSEFAPRRALIVGGSRGLGEVSAKILAAGGASVAITFRDGADDAQRVCDEIREFGAEASVLQYAAGGDLDEIVAFADEWQPTDLLFYATPAIKKTDTLFYNDLYFQRFAEVYVRGFSELIDALLSRVALQRLVYPSSVAVEELTKGMMEYSAAKAAGETICHYVARRHPSLKVAMPRLPRMATDQTVSVLSGADEAAVEYFVKLLRFGEAG
ncbi:MAG: SDR family NAD(P)-dependent oxidoreductase [Pseudomonadota bacterium]